MIKRIKEYFSEDKNFIKLKNKFPNTNDSLITLGLWAGILFSILIYIFHKPIAAFVILSLGLIYIILSIYVRKMYVNRLIKNENIILHTVKNKKIVSVTISHDDIDTYVLDENYQSIEVQYYNDITNKIDTISNTGIMIIKEDYSHDNHWHIGKHSGICIYKPISCRYIDAWDKW